MPEPLIDLTIADVVYRGKGLARHEGCVVFVPGVLPDEKVRARVTRRRKSFWEAWPEAILEPNPDRAEPVCPLAFRAGIPKTDAAPACPGCCYQHVRYGTEVALKQRQLVGFLERQCHADLSVLRSPIPSPSPLGYRNKIVLHAGKGSDSPVLGYIAEDNRTVLDVPSCPLAVPQLDALLQRLRLDTAFPGSLRPGESLSLRHTRHDGALSWSGAGEPRAPWLREHTVLGALYVPRDGFFQVNPGVTEHLVACFREMLVLCPGGVLIDLYCGSGLLGLAALQHGVSRVLGVDSDPRAIHAATRNARDHGLSGATFRVDRAAEGLNAVAPSLDAAQATVVLDPPRRGLDRTVLDALLAFSPSAIIYISCAADTLVRDLKVLQADGYAIRQVQMLDMFPRTPYFESVVLLTRDA